MPANEQTCFNIQRLRKLFAVCSVLLAVATLWMLGRDHFRPWKQLQRTGDRIESQLAQWQQAQLLTEDVVLQRERLELALSEELAQPLSPAVLTQLLAEMQRDAARRGVDASSFEELNEAVTALDQAALRADVSRKAWRQKQLDADQARLRLEDATRQDALPDTQLLQQLQAARDAVIAAASELRQVEAEVVPSRERVLQVLDQFVQQARFRDQQQQRIRKLEASELDVQKAQLGLRLSAGAGDVELKRIQDVIDERGESLRVATQAAESTAAHFQRLRHLRQRLVTPELAIRRRLADNQAESDRIAALLAENRSTYFRFWGMVPLPGRKWLELPVLDAFNSPRQIENLWSADLDRQSGSFGRVSRFDRCTTCHQSLDRASVHQPTQPARGPTQRLEFALTIPGDATDEQADVATLFGFELADSGLLDAADVTIKFVHPSGLARQAEAWRSASRSQRAGDVRVEMLQTLPPDASLMLGAAHPVGLRLGDNIVAVDGQPVPAGSAGRQWVLDQLAGAVRAAAEEPQSPLQIAVRRGLPHPFAGHPRLELFVGENSPHRMEDFGCTVCHDGQGSATEFKWGSHTPNDLDQRQQWRERYDWFDNPHWNFPMHAQRFVEASCLKCHHDVVELERSERYPEPPAGKLATGYRLIRNLGCYGCHEIQGYDSAGNRLGPDLRLEPNYAAAALQFRGAAGTGFAELTAREQQQVNQLIEQPEDEAARAAVYALLAADARLAARAMQQPETAPEALSGEALDQASPRFSSYVHRTLLPLLAAQETPGTLRKAGPSLRFVRHKLDNDYLRSWILQPRSVRPSTRMPHSFGLWNHLPAQQLRRRRQQLLDELAGRRGTSPEGDDRPASDVQADLDAVAAQLEQVDQLQQAERFEPVAVHCMTQYLQQQSQALDSVQPAPGVTAILTDQQRQQQIERGRVAFEELGCLACHDHQGFPLIQRYRDPDYVVEGPDLSDLATKFDRTRNATGAQWLYSWIVEPTRYSARTTMPSLQIEPMVHRDAEGNVTAVTDPVADLVAYLLSAPAAPWEPSAVVPTVLEDQDLEVLDQLTLTFLRDLYPESVAQRYLRDGIPAVQTQQVQGAERELLRGAEETDAQWPLRATRSRVAYVARKSLLRGGCFACHDIPGLEDAKPIGPGLNDWGSKDTRLLAFGHVSQYVRGQLEAAGPSEPGSDAAVTNISGAATAAGQRPVSSDALPAFTPQPATPQYYLRELESQSRVGFIYQKLTEPRSFDYQEARNKKYTQQLQMPQFQLSPVEREAIMTFVLGLVADPPRARYIYHPDPDTKALLAGTEVLTKYSCRGCHMLEPERWELTFPPDTFDERAGAATYPFVPQPPDHRTLLQSLALDRRGQCSATVVGTPSLSDDALPRIYDDEEFPIEEEEDESFELDRLILSLDLWQPAVLDGHDYQVGDGALEVEATMLRATNRLMVGR